MTVEQEAKRDLLKEHFARVPPHDIPTLTKMAQAMGRVGYPTTKDFGSAVDALYEKVEKGECL